MDTLLSFGDFLAGDFLAHTVTFRDFMAGNFMARYFLTGAFLAHHVTFGDFMAGNFLAGDFLGWILDTLSPSFPLAYHIGVV